MIAYYTIIALYILFVQWVLAGTGVTACAFLRIIQKNTMNNLLYIIAVVLVIIWATGYFAYNSGQLIHILLVIAIIAIILRLIKGRNIF